MNTDSRFILDLKHYSVLPDDRIRELFQLYRNGNDDARTQIIEANLRLAVFVAKKYHSVYREIPLDDLVQSGNIGLLKAVDRFDLDRETKFSTYAHWWIRAYIQRHISDCKKHYSVSIDSTVDDDLEFEPEDIERNTDNDAFENVDLVSGLLPALSNYEYVLIVNVYGLHGIQPRNFRELQHIFGVSFQRLQQQASEALAKMKRFARLHRIA